MTVEIWMDFGLFLKQVFVVFDWIAGPYFFLICFVYFWFWSNCDWIDQIQSVSPWLSSRSNFIYRVQKLKVSINNNRRRRQRQQRTFAKFFLFFRQKKDVNPRFFCASFHWSLKFSCQKFRTKQIEKNNSKQFFFIFFFIAYVKSNKGFRRILWIHSKYYWLNGEPCSTQLFAALRKNCCWTWFCCLFSKIFARLFFIENGIDFREKCVLLWSELCVRVCVADLSVIVFHICKIWLFVGTFCVCRFSLETPSQCSHSFALMLI